MDVMPSHPWDQEPRLAPGALDAVSHQDINQTVKTFSNFVPFLWRPQISNSHESSFLITERFLREEKGPQTMARV